MKKPHFIILILLTFSISKAQSHEIVFTVKNFESEFLRYEPIKRYNVSDKDFEWAQFVISETKKSVNDKEGHYNVAHYWNITTAFDKLDETKENLKLVFIKMANSEGGCKYVTSFKDKIKFDDKIPELYNEYYVSCSNKPEAKELDIEHYIRDNKLNTSLVKLIKTINLNDVKYRDSDEQTYRTKQPNLDKVNQKLIDSLYNVHEQYIGKTLVGKEFEFVMWAVIQHSNPEMMEKYLPIVHQAVNHNELDKTPLKMLIDRYYGLKYGYQVFGSQSGFGFEMADDETRNEIIAKYDLD